MWKTLTVLTILLAGAGAAFRYFNTETAKLEKDLLERSVANLTKVEGQLDSMGEEITKFTGEAKQTADDAEAEATKLATAKSQVSEKESMKTDIERQIAEKTARLDALKESTAAYGDIEELVSKSDEIALETATVSQELLTATESFKNFVATRINTEKTIVSLKEKETMVKEGKMTSLNARVSQNFGEWGFVVINAGAVQGVAADAMLDVKNGEEIVAKLLVTNLESNVAVCDVLSVADGQSISSGAKVVVAEESKWDPAKVAAAAAAAAASAPAAAAPAPAPAPGGGDPFGLDPAPGGDAPAAADDPFGLGGDTPEAEAPAGDDPFGLN